MSRVLPFLLILFITLEGCASDQQKADTFIREGKAYFEKQEYAKAEIQLKNAVKLEPESIEALQLLAQAYLQQKNTQKAFTTVLRLEQLEPDNLETKLQLASFYFLAQEWVEAEKKVAQVLAVDPDNIEGLYLKAGILGSKKEGFDTLEPIYDRILSLDAKQIKAMLVLARIYQAQGKSDKAEAILIKAVQTAPDDLKVNQALFKHYLAHKFYDKARAVLEELVRRKPEALEPRIMLATFHAGRNENSLAEESFLKPLNWLLTIPCPICSLPGSTMSMDSLIRQRILSKKPWPSIRTMPV